MSTLRPLGDRYVIDPILPPEKVNGLFIPESAREATKHGEVIAVGKLVEKDDIHTGDIVLFSPYAANPIEHEGKKMMIVRKHDIIAILP
jgi:chaperonin GroES